MLTRKLPFHLVSSLSDNFQPSLCLRLTAVEFIISLEPVLLLLPVYTACHPSPNLLHLPSDAFLHITHGTPLFAPSQKRPHFLATPPSLEEFDEWDRSVVGQFIDTRHFSLEEVREAVTLFWRSPGFTDVEQKDQYFQFKCSDPHDRDALFQLETLAIRGGLLVLRRSPAERPISRWMFTDAAVWVQLHNIPPLYHNSTVALGLA
ncbi:hypothetical protein Cgig2_023073 [Carnegiea gigantea]|uniref:Uncharacterized protein n=1 Tax=Carnegiea gigantea TaxID=171969 RepID=A0A9Q1JXX6_9CARY|nr:hypothetical protein Cgig2_023073 [Carnegiea gigantea]